MQYREADFVTIGQRENNSKRSYLVVNRLQGKHIPVEPAKAFAMFSDLANLLKDDYKNEKLLVIGFAETATAIGAAVAVVLDAFYIQTTREDIPGADYLFFSEEHSHATQQKLVRQDLDRMIGGVDRIVFVEDEVTTGKTILNSISVIQKRYGTKVPFAVASILNGMDQTARDVYKSRGIDLHFLVKSDYHGYEKTARQYQEAGQPLSLGRYIPCNTESVEITDLIAGTTQMETADETARQGNRKKRIPELKIGGRMDARRLLSARAYEQACRDFWHALRDRLGGFLPHRILVLGTEEFMYPAMYVAARMAENGADVRFHATTRSPVLVYGDARYPLHERYELLSLYDQGRRTFLYNLDTYEMVLLITDAQNQENEGIASLVHAVSVKNNHMALIRWCDG